MATRQLQNSTITEIKTIVGTQVPAALSSIDSHLSMNGWREKIDSNMRKEMGDILSASFIYGLKEDKNYEEVLAHLLSVLVSKTIPDFARAVMTPNLLMTDPLWGLHKKLCRYSSYSWVDKENETEKEYVERKVGAWFEEHMFYNIVSLG